MGVEQFKAPRIDRRLLAIWLPVFFVFSTVVAVTSGGADAVWGAWATGGYGVACLALWVSRRPVLPLLAALGGSLAIPMFRPVMAGPATADMSVLVRSAQLLLHHGSPYLPVGSLGSWRSYDPYLPAMALFGLPRALGLPGALGDPRPWLVAVTVAALAAAFAVAVPRRSSRASARLSPVLLLTVFVVASPLLAMPLSLGITDPPVTALVCLALACSVRAATGRQLQGAVQPLRLVSGPGAWTLLTGLVIGVACSMKATAWPALAILVSLFVARDGLRAATRLFITCVVTAAVLIASTAPRLVVDPRALFENTVAFPLGLASKRTPAASPLPGHLLAGAGHAGRLIALGVLLAAGLAVVASLFLRAPMDVGAATVRLALALTLMFLLAPEARFGYFAYPAALLVWLMLAGHAIQVVPARLERWAAQLCSRFPKRANTPVGDESQPVRTRHV